jgi:hypothetical protein
MIWEDPREERLWEDPLEERSFREILEKEDRLGGSYKINSLERSSNRILICKDQKGSFGRILEMKDCFGGSWMTDPSCPYTRLASRGSFHPRTLRLDVQRSLFYYVFFIQVLVFYHL